MARRLRIQYPGAIYHVMARGNARQDIVGDDADRCRLLAGLEKSVRRSGWVLYGFVFMTNHLHLVLKTPRPNLADNRGRVTCLFHTQFPAQPGRFSPVFSASRGRDLSAI